MLELCYRSLNTHPVWLLSEKKKWFLFFNYHNNIISNSFNIHDPKQALLHILLSSILILFKKMPIAILANNHNFPFLNRMIPRTESFASCIKFQDEGEYVQWSPLCLRSHLDYCLESLSFLQRYWDCEVIAKIQSGHKLFCFPCSQKYLISHLCLYGSHYAQELALI